MKIYTLDNDYLFKKTFSQERYLKHLLFNFFDIQACKIEYLNTALIKNHKDIKVGIVDMLLNVDGEIVILELQNIDRHNFKERLLFYASNIIANHCLEKGADYDQLKGIKVYAIINYKSFNDSIKDIVRLKRNNKIFTKKMEYQIFDLTKVNINNKETKYYELVSLFKIHNLDKLTKIIKDDLNMEILTEIKKYNLNSEEYKKMEDIERLMMNETEHYETAYFDGIEIGRSEGISLGKNEGKVEEKLDIAKNMLIENIDINLVSKITGLDKNQIELLK
ncbi:MAG: Rpn family recombination-promoting nuclease/putative transposase [Bacilli bacterium]|nr:Rpn family recombination-promoting nuclease/putative transposase [Bacilli bacterium]